MNEPLSLSKFEEMIYNTHLKVSRTHKELPFKYRKNFADVDDVTKGTIKKLGYFFRKFLHINTEDFFIAPYKIYPDEKYFGLSYYTTLKAVKAYTLYQNSKLYSDPDSPEQLQNIVSSLKFIKEYCTDAKIDLDQYIKYCPEKTPVFLIHLKEHKVNIFTLLGFNGFYNKIKKLDTELIKFIIGEEMYNRIDICKTKLFSSKKALNLISAGLEKIQKQLKKS